MRDTEIHMVRRNEFRSKRKRKGVIEFKNNKTVKEREKVGDIERDGE